MALTFTANVPLALRVKDKEKLLAAGDKVPAGADEQVVEALRKAGLLSVTGDAPAPADPTPAPVETPTTLPADGDNRKIWEAYAAVVGVDPAAYSSENKPALVTAVTEAHEAKVKAAAGKDGEGTGS